MIQAKSVTVKKLPSLRDAAACRRFYRDLIAEFKETYRPRVVFDLTAVEHMTAQGVDLLVRCIHQIADRDGEVKFAEASPQTELVLELTQITGIAEIYDTVEEAIDSWNLTLHALSTDVQRLRTPQAA